MPTMTDFADLLPEFNILIPNVPEPLALSRLAKSARDFCQRSLAWESSVILSLLAERPCYDLRLPPDTEIAAIVRVTYRGQQIRARAPEQLAHNRPRWASESGDPRHYFLEDYATLRLYPTPNNAEAGAVCATLALMPQRDAVAMDARVLQRWEDYIIAGAQALLHAMPAKDWTLFDAVSPLLHKVDYGISMARLSHRAGDAVGVQSVEPHPLV